MSAAHSAPPRPPARKRVAVVGGGASGLASAFYLSRAGHDVELIEREPVLGGRSAPGRLGSRSVVFGGKNVGRRYSCFREFTDSLGPHPYEPFGINSSRVERGRMVTVDSSRRLGSLRALASQGAPRDLAKLARLALKVRFDERRRFLGSDYFDSLAERHDHRPLSAHFGERLRDRVLRPMTVRMNGAEPDEVFLGTFGTNLGMLLDTYDQLRFGIEPVLERCAELFPVRLGTSAEGLLVRGGEVTGVRVREPGGGLTQELYDAVVLATTARASARLLREHHAGLADLLEGVRYFPAAVVLAEYERPAFSEQVRAIVFDGGPLSNAGAYGIEDRHIVRYTFSGRAARPLLERADAAERLLDAGEAELGRYMPVSAEGRVHAASRQWDAAYCAYVPFHGRFRRALASAQAELPGLHLTGDYLWGASMEACFRAARACASGVDRAPAGRLGEAQLASA